MMEPLVSLDTAILLGRVLVVVSAVLFLLAAAVLAFAIRRQAWVIVAAMSIAMLSFTFSGVTGATNTVILSRLVG